MIKYSLATKSSCNDQRDLKINVKYAFRLKAQVLGLKRSTTHRILASADTSELQAGKSNCLADIFPLMSIRPYKYSWTHQLLPYTCFSYSLPQWANHQKSESLTHISLNTDFQSISREDCCWVQHIFLPLLSQQSPFPLVNHMVRRKADSRALSSKLMA